MSKPHIQMPPASHRNRRISHSDFMSPENSESVPDKSNSTEPPHVPTVEELRAMMHRQVATPNTVLDEIRRKIQNGDYLTRQAAEQSAKRMMDE